MEEIFDPHAWYFVVRCEACREFIPLGEAPPIDAHVEPKFAELHVICPHCATNCRYRQDQVSRQLRRAPPRSEPDPADERERD
jgi:hypothetical protein